MRGSADLVGITTDADSQVLRLTASKVDVKFDGERSVEEVLKEEPTRIKGFVTLIVKNLRTTARSLKGSLYVTNEEAGPVEVIPAHPSPLPMSNKTPLRPQVVSNTGSVRTARSQAAKIVHPVARVQHRVQPESVNRRIIVRNHSSSQAMMVKQASNQVSSRIAEKAGVAAVRHVTKRSLDMVLPREGEHAVLMLRGHAFGLIRYLTQRVPLHPSFVPTITRQLFLGSRRVGAVSTGGNEVVVVLRIDQVMRLHAVVKQRFNNMTAEESVEMVKALEEALARDSRPTPEPEFSYGNPTLLLASAT
jgi:hypothetical protein